MIISVKKYPKTKLVEKAAQMLKKGGLIVVPSDTVYGLAVDATNKQAVAKLIDFKSRPKGKPISVFVHSFKEVQNIVIVKKNQKKLLEKLLPGSFTVVLPSKHVVNANLESEKRTLGIRLIDQSFINNLTKIYKKPITATSANVSGTSPHYSVESLLKSLPEKKKKLIDLIVDYGKLPYNKPSTVIDFTQDEVMVLRQGDSSLSKSQKFFSKSELETKKIALDLIKQWEKNAAKKPLVIILQGELGTGKTQFVKGIGKYFGIKNIISPTFVIYYEYKIPKKNAGNLYHIDLYNVTEKSEFEYLGFEKMLKPGNVICIEWGEKSGEIINLLHKHARIIYVSLEYINIHERKMIIRE